MCGIVGIYNRHEGPASIASLVDRMCQAIVHRVPEDQGMFVEPGEGLGMRRLSISNEDGTVTVVFNGECFQVRIP